LYQESLGCIFSILFVYLLPPRSSLQYSTGTFLENTVLIRLYSSWEHINALIEDYHQCTMYLSFFLFFSNWLITPFNRLFLVSLVSDENLLKFLHWKPNVKRASERFRSFLKWQSENPWSHTTLKLTQDETLSKLMKSQVVISPETITAKDGSSVLIGRLRNNDMSDGRTPEDVCRMLLYVIDNVLSRNENAQMNGVSVFHDLNGLSKNNVHVGIPKLLVKAIIGHLPLKIKGMYLLNAPFFFKSLFSVVSTMFFPKKLKQRIHFMDSLHDIYKVIDQDLLLVEHGGKLEFDIDEWIQKQCDKEVNNEFHSLLQKL